MTDDQELLDIAADIEHRLTKDWRQYPGHLRRAAQACRQLVELRKSIAGAQNVKPKSAAEASVGYMFGTRLP